MTKVAKKIWQKIEFQTPPEQTQKHSKKTQKPSKINFVDQSQTSNIKTLKILKNFFDLSHTFHGRPYFF